MPPVKRKLRKVVFLLSKIVFLVSLAVIAMSDIWSVVSELIIWFRKRFLSRERLCEIRFNNWSDKAKKTMTEYRMLKRPPRETQEIAIFLTSPNDKKLSFIKMRFGKSIGFGKRIWEIAANRVKDRRILVRPSRFTLDVLRIPKIVTDASQPEIRGVSIICGSDERIESNMRIENEWLVVSFGGTQIEIPAGEFRGGSRAIQVVLAVSTPVEWKGVIQCVSRIGRLDQEASARVHISGKYEVPK